jgi:hypothetical protein
MAAKNEWKWLIDLVASGVAAVTAYLATKGVQVTPEEVAARAREYAAGNAEELRKAEGEYLDEFKAPPP